MAKTAYFEKDKAIAIGAIYYAYGYHIHDGGSYSVSDTEWARLAATFSAEVFDTAPPTSSTTTTVTTTGE